MADFAIQYRIVGGELEFMVVQMGVDVNRIQPLNEECFSVGVNKTCFDGLSQ